MKKLPPIVLAILIPALFLLDLSTAEEENNAEYLADGSNTFWFVQITDTHISTWLNQYYDDNILFFLDEGLSTINPWFVVNTGDLTDSTNGVNYLQGPQLEEWQEYKGYLDSHQLTADFFFDVAGNHDAYSDGNLNFYREHSRSGAAYETTQPCWALEMTYGQYNFVSLSTADNNGPVWPGDNPTLTQEELNEFETNLSRLGEAKFWMAFGHHPLQGVGRHEDAVQLLKQYNIHDYACGHAHDYVIRRDFDYLTQYRIDSMGQSEVNNIGIYAIDNNTLSFTATSIKDTWPALVVTAPVAAKLKSTDGEDVTNPHAVAVPNQCENAPLRVLAFDNSTIDSIRFKIDSGSWQNMTARIYQDNQWRAAFDATSLVAGIHELKIEVDGSKVRSFDSNFMVVDAVCDISEEDEDNPFEVGEIIVDGLTDGDIDDNVDGDDTDNNIDGDDDSYIDGDIESVENQEIDFEQTEKESSESNMICDPGSLRCKDDITVEICNIAGFWQDSETCEGGYCLNGECNYDKTDAPDGDIQADGDQINQINPGSAGDSGCSNTANDSSWLVLLFLLGICYRQRLYEINL